MNSDSALPAISRRPRKATLSTEPPKRFHRDLSTGVQLEFSKEKMLLLDLLSPDYYSVRLVQANELPLTLTISADTDHVTVQPHTLEFTTEGQEIDVMVYTSEEVRDSGAVRLQHSVKGQRESVALTAYFVEKIAYKVYACGLDDKSQLGTNQSLKKFLVANFPSEESFRAEICEPIPEVVYGNDDVLFHETLEDQTFCSVNPPSWTALAAGDSHTLSITNEGQVYTWGHGTCGQLGITVAKSQEIARNLAAKQGIIKAKFTNGSPYSSHHSQAELLESWVPVPTLISELTHVWQVACGAQHSLILTRKQELYVFGRGDSGQLGLGTKENCHTPRDLPKFGTSRIVKVAAM